MRLSVLDQSPIRKDGSAAEAVAETIALAKACERLGYHRYWLAEHHNTGPFAGSAPEVLKAVARANQNNAGIYGTVTRIGRLAVGQTVVLHR